MPDDAPPQLSLEDWVAELIPALGLSANFTLDIDLVLDLARDAAHSIARPAAPVTTYLVAYAAAQGDGSPQTVRELSQIASRLALAHGSLEQ
jgi:uncharacterized protein DUF6457